MRCSPVPDRLVTPAPSSRPLAVFVHGSAELYGSDKVLLNLVDALADDARMTPVVVLHEDGPLARAVRAAGVEVHVGVVAKIQRSMFGPLAPWRLWSQLRAAMQGLDRIAAGRPVGLVYSNTLAVLGGACWAWRRGLAHLWHVHEIILRPAPVAWGLPRLCQWWAHRVVSNSESTQAWLLDRAPGLASRAEVVFNGLPPVPARDAAAAQAFRQELGLADDDVLLTLAGRINHWKGQDLLIEALSLLQQSGRLGRLHAAIVGDVFAGHEDIRSRLQAQVQRLGLQQRVHFVPFVPNIYPVWWASDLAVVPSLEPEPFGMVAIEAMACALPVVAAAHGGLLDIVRDGETGVLFTPRSAPALADSLQRLAQDASLRGRLGAAGAQRQLERFSLRAQVEQTRRICHGMLATA